LKTAAPAHSSEVKMQSEAKAKALEQFTDYFVKNYPGPDTIIYDPNWHAPKIFAAAHHAITAALSEQQAGEVKIKPLEWPNDSDWNIATSELGRYVVRPCLATNFSGQWLLRRAGAENSDKTLYPSEDAAKAAAQADYEQRIRSALVDVPAVEPVAWLPADDAPRGVYALIKHRSGQLDLCYKTDNGEPFLETWRYAGTAKRGEQAPWPESYIPVSDLRTSPPLYREGEDSAEVERLANAADRILGSFETLLEQGHSKSGAKMLISDQQRKRIDALRAALAATRRGSARAASGGSE
jgi:hypothetical protein